MNNQTLFTLKSPPTTIATHISPPRLTKTPTQNTCPKCGQPTLRALADGLQEISVDPTLLTQPAVQAAHLLGITVYRSPPAKDFQPSELWWTHPLDPHEYHKHMWFPTHQCGRKPLPGFSIPHKPPPVMTPTSPPF